MPDGPVEPPRTRDALVTELLEVLAGDATISRSSARALLQAAAGVVASHPAKVDLKIAGAALMEMGEAFAMFARYRDEPKVTVFGSARTAEADPLYVAARNVAAELAAAGWMVITGAGPGIMHAAMEGAGREHSIGVSIRLPFETGANPIIAGDEKYVSMKYFFTRKLMLVKESKGFVCLPGGFGTLDETFELLTLTQTGKGLPVPIVLLDTPGDPYWEEVHTFIDHQLVRRGLVSASDTGLYLITDDPSAAVAEVLGFYRNYESLRYIGDRLVLRLQRAPTDEQLALLNERFGHLCASGSIARAGVHPLERKEADRIDLPRIGLAFARHGYGDLRTLINMVNTF